jgi:electron transfer flavoprotein beta subunit
VNIIVFAKTVRFLQAQTGSDPRQNNIAPGDLVDMLNPFDEAALEVALRIKDAAPEAEITVVSLGGPSAQAGLRRCLAMGADRASHILYGDYVELDSWASAAILAAQARRMRYDLILCGRQAIDSNAGLVGPYLAAQLAIPHISRIIKLAEPGSDGKITAERRLDRGDRETVECTAPALLTVERDINVARIPTLPAMLAAAKLPIENCSTEDLETAPTLNRTKTIRLSNPKAKRRAGKQLNPALSAAERMKLMMKGGGAPAPAKTAALLEGCGEDVLEEFERLLISSGVHFRP